jgi:pimeloyl-ACP methyl ester carboxylesterase
MKNFFKRLWIGLLVTLVLFGAGFIWYVNDYYRATPAAKQLMQDVRVSVSGRFTTIQAPNPNDTAIIFYPGGKVEAEAYLPLLFALSDRGFTCVLVDMPFNLAVFDVSAADRIYNKLLPAEHIYLMGHSLGGAMASSHFADSSQYAGLILLGAYIYGDVDPEKALTIYGTEDIMLDKTKVIGPNVVVLDGANHAQFGDYGAQKGDGIATMSKENQLKLTVNYIEAFISQNNQ